MQKHYSARTSLVISRFQDVIDRSHTVIDDFLSLLIRDHIAIRKNIHRTMR